MRDRSDTTHRNGRVAKRSISLRRWRIAMVDVSSMTLVDVAKALVAAMNSLTVP